MSVFTRGRLTLVRMALGLGILAIFPFVAAGGASAAIGLGQAPNLSNRADLQAVHLLSGIQGTKAEYCFDKPVQNTPSSTGFILQGYRWDTVLNSAPGQSTILDSSTSNGCAANQGIQVTFNPQGSPPNQTAADLTQYTIGGILPGTVTANVNNGTTNLGDSAPVVESGSKAGTRGSTSGPNLQAVTFGGNAQSNQLVFVFDKNVRTSTLNPVNFGFADTSGNQFIGTAIAGVAGTNSATGLSGNVVLVQFNASVSNPTVTANTGNAVQAYVYHQPPNNDSRGVPPATSGAGRDNAGNPTTWAPTQSVAPVGASGPVGAGPFVRPAVVSSEESGSNTMDFVFDQVVQLCAGSASQTASSNAVGNPGCTTTGVNNAAATDFYAVASNGDEIQGSTTQLLGDNKTVRVTFTQNLNNYLEEIVAGSVTANAVSANGATNLPGGKAAGTNVGKSVGYTNGPDANSVVFNSNSGTATVSFDQRVATSGTSGAPVGPDGLTATSLNNWALLDQNGILVANPTSATVQNTGFTSTVTLSFANRTQLSSSVAKALEIFGNQTSSSAADTTQYSSGFAGTPGSAVFSFGNPHAANASGFNAAGNVQQILAPTYASALVARARHTHFKTVHITAKKTRHGSKTKHARRA